ncbi:hypothetical protein Tco_1561648, partial [Tanacetum coccineum]
VHELEISSAGLQEKVTAYENCIDQLEKFQDDQMKVVNDKLDKLYIDFVEMALHLEERFYPHLLTTIAAAVAISKAIEKGMQDGLSAGITHGKEGRALIDVAAYNPSAKVDYDKLLPAILGAGTEGASTSFVMVPTTANTATTLSITVASTGFVTSLSVDDYEVMGTDDQAGTNGIAAPFPNVEDADHSSVICLGYLALVADIPSPQKLFSVTTAVCSFYHAVSLWVFNRSKVLADAQLFAPIIEWIVWKLFSFIRDNLSGESKFTDN